MLWAADGQSLIGSSPRSTTRKRARHLLLFPTLADRSEEARVRAAAIQPDSTQTPAGLQEFSQPLVYGRLPAASQISGIMNTPSRSVVTANIIRWVWSAMISTSTEGVTVLKLSMPVPNLKAPCQFERRHSR
jgi:hypothetical protein